MGTWQLQEAKAKLSEVIETARKSGPQIITQRGVETAVIVPIDQWKQSRTEKKQSLMDVLRSGPKFDLNIPPRGRLRHRKPIVF